MVKYACTLVSYKHKNKKPEVMIVHQLLLMTPIFPDVKLSSFS